MRLGTIVFFVTPSSVELSVRRADLGWGQPILMIAWRRGNIYLAVMKRASITNLDVEDMTNLMIWVRVRSSLLLASMGTFLERNILDPAQLRKCFPQNDRRAITNGPKMRAHTASSKILLYFSCFHCCFRSL